MRIPWAGTARFAVAIVFGLGQSVHAAGDGRSAPPRAAKKEITTSWWNPLGIGEKKNDKKPIPKADKDDAKKAARADKDVSPDIKSVTKSESSPERTREQLTLFRRLDVCDQLKLVASQKHDDQLMRSVEELDARVWDTYLQRVSGLDAGQAVAGSRDLEIGGLPTKDDRVTDLSSGRSEPK